MKAIKKSGDGSSGDKSSLTSHGVIVLATGAVLVLIWRGTGSKSMTGIAGIIMLLLVLKNYGSIVSQLEGL